MLISLIYLLLHSVVTISFHDPLLHPPLVSLLSHCHPIFQLPFLLSLLFPFHVGLPSAIITGSSHAALIEPAQYTVVRTSLHLAGYKATSLVLVPL